jgi:hypothetical protein
MISQQKIEERKTDRALINEIRAARKKLQKEQEGMTSDERVAFVQNSVRNFIIENGYTLKYADGTTIP